MEQQKQVIMDNFSQICNKYWRYVISK